MEITNMPGFNKNIMDNVESAMTSRLEEHHNKHKRGREKESKETIVIKEKEQRKSNKGIVTNNDEQKKKDNNYFPLGPRGSRTEKAYEDGMMPVEHQRLYNGFKKALEDATSGELILQRVLDDVGMFRASALRIVKFLVKYGYIEYEARNHHIFVRILK